MYCWNMLTRKGKPRGRWRETYQQSCGEKIPHGRIVKIELPPLPEGYIDEIHKLSAEYGKWLRCTTLVKEDK